MSSRVCLIIYDLPVYISSCLFSLMSSGLLVIPGVSCPALSCLDVLIKYYHLSVYPRPRVPVPPSCVHRDSLRQDTMREFFLQQLKVLRESVVSSQTKMQEHLKASMEATDTNLKEELNRILTSHNSNSTRRNCNSDIFNNNCD